MNKLFIGTLSVAVFLVAGVVLAQEETRTRTRERVEARTETQDKREEARTEIKAGREELRIKLRQEREALKQQVEERKKELKVKVEEKRGELKDKIEQKREELKERLERIKDERKKEIVERIDKRMDELNERLLDHYLSVLDKLGGVLVRIAERADKAEERGVDVAVVRVAIDEANRAILAAKTAIETQSGKTYTIQVNTEEGLKNDVGKARRAFHDDLSGVRLAVKAARDAVHQAATTLARLPKPQASETVAPSPSPTVSQ